jgi:hypothetical protein
MASSLATPPAVTFLALPHRQLFEWVMTTNTNRARPSVVTEMMRTTVKIAMSAVGATLAGMLFVGVFVGALHQPAPRQVPVGVAGLAAAARQVGADLARHSPGAFTVTRIPTRPRPGRPSMIGTWTRRSSPDRADRGCWWPARPARSPPRP